MANTPRNYARSESSKLAAWMLPAHGEGTLLIASAVFEQYCDAALDIPDPEVLAGLVIGEADRMVPSGRTVTEGSLARAIARLPAMRSSLERDFGDFPLLPGGFEASRRLPQDHAQRTIQRFFAAAGMTIDAGGLDLLAAPHRVLRDETGAPEPVLSMRPLAWQLAWVADGALGTNTVTRAEVATATYALHYDYGRTHHIDVTPSPEEVVVEPEQPEYPYIGTTLVEVPAEYASDSRMAVVLRMLPWERIGAIASRRDGSEMSGIDALCAAIASTDFPEILAGQVAGSLLAFGGPPWLTAESTSSAMEFHASLLSSFPAKPPMGIPPGGDARGSMPSRVEAALPGTLTVLLPPGMGSDTTVSDGDAIDILARFMGAFGWGPDAWNPAVLPMLIVSRRPWTAGRLADLCSAVSTFGHEYPGPRLHADPVPMARLILPEMDRTSVIPTGQRMMPSTRIAVTMLPLEGLRRLAPEAAARFCELAGATDRPEVLAACATSEIAGLPAGTLITTATIEAASDRMRRITPGLPPRSPLAQWSWPGQRGVFARLTPEVVHEALSAFLTAAGEDPGRLPRAGMFKEFAPPKDGWTLHAVAQFGSRLATRIAAKSVPDQGEIISLLGTFVEALGTSGRQL